MFSLSPEKQTDPNEKAAKQSTDSTAVHYDPSSRLPLIPARYTTEQERADFLSYHWWGETPMEEFQGYAAEPEGGTGEQRMVDFLSVLPLCSREMQKKALFRLLDLTAADKSAYEWACDILEKYLWDENSPMYNEELFIPVLRHRLSNKQLDEGSEARAAHLLRAASKNRIGEKPYNLLLTLPDGKQKRLQELNEIGEERETLLVFYDIDCRSCQELLHTLSADPDLSKLNILTIYLHNQDEESWKTFIKQLPENWIHTYDSHEAVLMEEAFYLRSSSALYLLNDKGTIIAKNTTVPLLKERRKEK